mgnify:CR=1 FL=1
MSELITEGNIRKQTVLERIAAKVLCGVGSISIFERILLALVAIGMSLSGISQELKLKRAQ